MSSARENAVSSASFESAPTSTDAAIGDRSAILAPIAAELCMVVVLAPPELLRRSSLLFASPGRAAVCTRVAMLALRLTPAALGWKALGAGGGRACGCGRACAIAVLGGLAGARGAPEDTREVPMVPDESRGTAVSGRGCCVTGGGGTRRKILSAYLAGTVVCAVVSLAPVLACCGCFAASCTARVNESLPLRVTSGDTTYADAGSGLTTLTTVRSDPELSAQLTRRRSSRDDKRCVRRTSRERVPGEGVVI